MEAKSYGPHPTLTATFLHTPVALSAHDTFFVYVPASIGAGAVPILCRVAPKASLYAQVGSEALRVIEDTILLSLSLSSPQTFRVVAKDGAIAQYTFKAIWKETYKNFVIDYSLIKDRENVANCVEIVKQQIDLVYLVGLSDAFIRFMQTVPLVFDATQRRRLILTPALYATIDGSVHFEPSFTNKTTKPILLHELLHAYHDQIMENGFKNAQILTFYQQALHEHIYNPASHAMSDAKEYFACSASTYLYDTTAQEPFRRERIKSKAENFYAYLQKLFGENAGRYQGALSK